MGLIRSSPDEWGTKPLTASQQAPILASLELCRTTEPSRAEARQTTRQARPRRSLPYSYSTTSPTKKSWGYSLLDAHNRLISDAEVFRGTLSRAAVEPPRHPQEGAAGQGRGIHHFPHAPQWRPESQRRRSRLHKTHGRLR